MSSGQYSDNASINPNTGVETEDRSFIEGPIILGNSSRHGDCTAD